MLYWQILIWASYLWNKTMKKLCYRIFKYSISIFLLILLRLNLLTKDLSYSQVYNISSDIHSQIFKFTFTNWFFATPFSIRLTRSFNCSKLCIAVQVIVYEMSKMERWGFNIKSPGKRLVVKGIFLWVYDISTHGYLDPLTPRPISHLDPWH
jgi:hypothetical protein